MKPILVQKYGGSSLADLDRIRGVAQRIARTVADGYRVVAVVSAMGKTTDELLGRAKSLSANPNPRELDMLLSVGERISTALLAIALGEIGLPAISFTGSQSGLITNTRHNRARIVEVRPFRVQDELDAGKVVVVAGYQGVSYTREITTLGRGGTDTTAVALAAALGAEHCEILSDVDGVYTADPKLVPDASRIAAVDHETMLALARNGSKVLNQECVQHAARHGIAIFAKATFGPRDDSGTVVRANPSKEPRPVTAIAERHSVLVIELHDPSATAQLLGLLASLGAHPCALEGGGERPLCATLALEDVHRQTLLEARLAEELGGRATVRTGLGTVTLVGHGFGEEPTVLERVIAAAVEVCGKLPACRLGPLELTLTTESRHVTPLVRRLHQALLGPPRQEAAT
jgi:aspartate kinase